MGDISDLMKDQMELNMTDEECEAYVNTGERHHNQKKDGVAMGCDYPDYQLIEALCDIADEDSAPSHLGSVKIIYGETSNTIIVEAIYGGARAWCDADGDPYQDPREGLGSFLNRVRDEPLLVLAVRKLGELSDESGNARILLSIST